MRPLARAVYCSRSSIVLCCTNYDFNRGISKVWAAQVNIYRCTHSQLAL